MDETTEIAKAGALMPVTRLLEKLLGPSADQLGKMWADRLFVARMKNFIVVARKAERMLDDANLRPHAVPSRWLIPMIESCSVEDNDDLQERWAGLLASASQEGDSFSPSFIETLRQLTPQEARYLERILKATNEFYKGGLDSRFPIPSDLFRNDWGIPSGAQETYERLGLLRRDFETLLSPLVHDDEREPNGIESQTNNYSCFTQYGLKFLAACKGPQKGQQSTPPR